MKNYLRKLYLNERNQLNIEKISHQTTRLLADFLRQRRLQHVMIYLPFRNEISLISLMKYYPEAEYYLPRINEQRLTVHPYSSPREVHPYGFEQPAEGALVVGEETLEAVLVPGLAFDRAGYRLGYGGGYYDRFLSEIPVDVFAIGVAPNKLIVDNLPREAWDVPVGWLASEKGVIPAEKE